MDIDDTGDGDADDTIHGEKSPKPNLLFSTPIKNVYLSIVQDFGDVGSHEIFIIGSISAPLESVQANFRTYRARQRA